MNKAHFIRAMDEGYFCSNNCDEHEGTTALMVNPAAPSDVLVDAAMARAARIVDLTKPFLEAENTDLSMDDGDFVRALISVGGMAREVHQILRAVLEASPAEDANREAA